MDDEGKMTVFVTSGPELPSAVRHRFTWQTLLLQWTTKQK